MKKRHKPVKRQALNLSIRPESKSTCSRLGGHLHSPVKVHDGDRIGKAVERLLYGVLNLSQLRIPGAPGLPKTFRHRVESLRQLADFVLGIYFYYEIQISRSNVLSRPNQASDRQKNPASSEEYESASHHSPDDQQKIHLVSG